MGRIYLLPVLLHLLFFGAATARGGALPALDWNSGGTVDWSSGYVIGYGRSNVGVGDGNAARRRSSALKKAHRSASEYLYRACLGVTIQEKLRVKDYLREDPELREELRRAVNEVPPWSIRIGEGGVVSVAVRYPMGGTGLSGLLGRIKGWYGEEGWRQAGAGWDSVEQETDATGIVITVGEESFSPALRPRILDRDGATLLTYEQSGESAKDRAAYIPYYTSLSAGMQDPLLGPEPLLVRVKKKRGTDIILPPFVMENIFSTPAGRKILEEVRIVIVKD